MLADLPDLILTRIVEATPPPWRCIAGQVSRRLHEAALTVWQQQLLPGTAEGSGAPCRVPVKRHEVCGRVKLLQLAVSQGCILDAEVSEAAAAGGHLQVSHTCTRHYAAISLAFWLAQHTYTSTRRA